MQCTPIKDALLFYLTETYEIIILVTYFNAKKRLSKIVECELG